MAGDPIANSRLFQHQGPHPTCLVTAAFQILVKEGAKGDDGQPLTYNELIDKVTDGTITENDNQPIYNRNKITDRFATEPNRPLITNDAWDDIDAVRDFLIDYEHKPPTDRSLRPLTPEERIYLSVKSAYDHVMDSLIEDTPQGSRSLADALNSPNSPLNIVGDLSGLKAYMTSVSDYRNSPTYEETEVEVTTREVISFNPASSGSWNSYTTILDNWNIPYHYGNGRNFAHILLELRAGNSVFVALDSKELWVGSLFELAAQKGDVLSQLVTGQEDDASVNHAAWITGIVVIDDVEYVVINDSGPDSGAANIYPMEQFIASFGDGFYTYIATGDQSHYDGSHQRELYERIDNIPSEVTREIIKNRLADDFYKGLESLLFTGILGEDTNEFIYNILTGDTDIYNDVLEDAGLDAEKIDSIVETTGPDRPDFDELENDVAVVEERLENPEDTFKEPTPVEDRDDVYPFN